MSVPVQVAPTTLLSPPESEWVTEDLFTYWQPYLPPGLSAASPLTGACFNGGKPLQVGASAHDMDMHTMPPCTSPATTHTRVHTHTTVQPRPQAPANCVSATHNCARAPLNHHP
jgi:hypothetical protein